MGRRPKTCGTSKSMEGSLGTARIETGYAAVLIVVHAYREKHHGEEIIRIISARAAETNEIRRYQEQAMD
jgi:uncharacterized DUF497 family protein